MANRGPDPPPFFPFLFFLIRGPLSYISCYTPEFLPLYALLLKGAREPPHPLLLGTAGRPHRTAFSHTNEPRKHHVSLSINDFYGRPPFLFLPRGRKDLADRAAAPRAPSKKRENRSGQTRVHRRKGGEEAWDEREGGRGREESVIR